MSATQQQRRLDTRKCLYGEPRLSDAQVIALRAAARATLSYTVERYTKRVWKAGCGPERFKKATITSLVHRHQALSIHPGNAVARTADITPRGRKLLAAIDAANAEDCAND